MALLVDLPEGRHLAGGRRTVAPAVHVRLTATAQIIYEMSYFYLVAARPGPDRRTNLGNRSLTLYHADGPAEHTEKESPSAVRDALEERFGIDTSGVDGLDGRLAELFGAT